MNKTIAIKRPLIIRPAARILSHLCHLSMLQRHYVGKLFYRYRPCIDFAKGLTPSEKAANLLSGVQFMQSPLMFTLRFMCFSLSGVLLIAVVWLAIRLAFCVGNNKATAVDVAALAFVSLQLATTAVSSFRPEAIHSLTGFCIALCLYCLVRSMQSSAAAVRVFLRALAIMALVISCADLYLLHVSLQAFSVFPALAVESFRASFPLVLGPTRNDGAMVLLSLLPLVFGYVTLEISNKQVGGMVLGLLSLILLVLSLVATYSRGIYLASFTFLLTLVWLCTRSKLYAVIRWPLGVITVVLLVIPFTALQTGMIETLHPFHTISQVRSSDGRIWIWRQQIAEVTQFPLFGRGGFSGGFTALKRMRGQSGQAFSVISYNSALETLASSGIAGLLIYCFFFLSPIKRSVSDNSHCESSTGLLFVPITAGVIALLVRDLTYSSIVLHAPSICLAWINVAVLNNSLFIRNHQSGALNSSRSEELWSPSGGRLTFNASSSACNKKWLVSDLRRFDMCLSLRRRCLSHMRCLLHLSSLRTLGIASIAVTLLSLCLIVRQQLAECLYARASAALEAEKWASASQLLLHAIKLEDDQSLFYSAHGLVMADEALGLRMPSNPWSTQSPDCRCDLALLRVAESDYHRAIVGSPDDSTLRVNLGWIRLFLGDADGASMSFRNAVASDGDDVIARVSLGLDLERHQEVDAATQEYTQAIALYPRIVDSQFFYDLKARHPEAAEISVSNALKRVTSVHTSLAIAAQAKLHEARGESSIARKQYFQAVSQLPNLSYAWANLGSLEARQGEFANAARDSRRALVLNGANKVAASVLASDAYRSGNIVLAQTMFRRSLLAPLYSQHAERTWRIYHLQPLDSDDLIPAALLAYTTTAPETPDNCVEWMLGMSGRDHQTLGERIGRMKAQELCPSH